MRPPTTESPISTRASARTAFSVVAALLAVAVFLCGWDFSLAAAPGQPAPAPRAPAAPAESAVKITFTTVPPRKSMVFWGKKRLGVIAPHQPLVVQRPRDSGPLDVVVKSTGYLSVQTRAYTFGDSKVAVRLTPPDQKKTLLGYREAPPDAGAPSPGTAENSGPDGGVR